MAPSFTSSRIFPFSSQILRYVMFHGVPMSLSLVNTDNTLPRWRNSKEREEETSRHVTVFILGDGNTLHIIINSSKKGLDRLEFQEPRLRRVFSYNSSSSSMNILRP